MYGKISDVSISSSNKKYRIGTVVTVYFFKLTLELFRVTAADANIGRLKSFHLFLEKYLYHMLVKFEQNCMVPTTLKF